MLLLKNILTMITHTHEIGIVGQTAQTDRKIKVKEEV
jgi:hypothetical protein